MKTFKQIRIFNMSVERFFEENKGNMKSQLGVFLIEISKSQIKPILIEFEKERNKLWKDNVWIKYLENALTDKETGAVLYAPKGDTREFLFDKKGLLNVIKVEEEYSTKIFPVFLNEWDKKEFEITELTIDYVLDKEVPFVEAFEGFVNVNFVNTPIREVTKEETEIAVSEVEESPVTGDVNG